MSVANEKILRQLEQAQSSSKQSNKESPKETITTQQTLLRQYISYYLATLRNSEHQNEDPTSLKIGLFSSNCPDADDDHIGSDTIKYISCVTSSKRDLSEYQLQFIIDLTNKKSNDRFKLMLLAKGFYCIDSKDIAEKRNIISAKRHFIEVQNDSSIRGSLDKWQMIIIFPEAMDENHSLNILFDILKELNDSKIHSIERLNKCLSKMRFLIAINCILSFVDAVNKNPANVLDLANRGIGIKACTIPNLPSPFFLAAQYCFSWLARETFWSKNPQGYSPLLFQRAMLKLVDSVPKNPEHQLITKYFLLATMPPSLLVDFIIGNKLIAPEVNLIPLLRMDPILTSHLREISPPTELIKTIVQNEDVEKKEFSDATAGPATAAGLAVIFSNRQNLTQKQGNAVATATTTPASIGAALHTPISPLKLPASAFSLAK